MQLHRAVQSLIQLIPASILVPDLSLLLVIPQFISLFLRLLPLKRFILMLPFWFFLDLLHLDRLWVLARQLAIAAEDDWQRGH
jgi:hypothetical protein